MITTYSKNCAQCGKQFASPHKKAFMCSRRCAAKSGKGKTGLKPKHGGCSKGKLSPIYKRWMGIKARCLYPTSNKYTQYGGRGITLCDEWVHFENFEAWALKSGYAKNLQIDRIDNDLGYSPDNCRWVTPLQNMSNRRRSIIFPNGMTTAQVAKQLGMSPNSLRFRLRAGLSKEDTMKLAKVPNGGKRRWFKEHNKNILKP